MSTPKDPQQEVTRAPTSEFSLTGLGDYKERDTTPELSLIGQVLKGAYRVDSKIGEGGMGTVYQGTQLALGRAVAVKTILPAAQADLAIVQRFFREAKLLSQLNHPNIVNIIDFGVAEPGPIPFMVMELIKGQSLDNYVTSSRRAPLPLVLSLMTQICAGVQAAHDCQIIHRDLKPSNIFVVPVSGNQFPTVKILDFGLAKPVEQIAPGKTPITQAGTAMGTCGFTAPEQLQATSEPDARSDIYSLGAVLYYLLTGQLPFKGNTHNAVMLKQMTGTPEPLDFTALNLQGAEGLDVVIRKAMSFVPNDRYRTAAELLLAVEAAVATLVPPTRSPAPLTPLPAPEPAKIPPTTVKKKPFNWVPAAAGSLLLLGGIAAWMIWGGRDRAGSAPGGDATAAVLTATAPGVTADEIRVGMSAPFSGPAKELGRGMQVGIDAYLQYVNTHGGIHGRKVRLIARDDGYEPKQTAATIAELLTGQQVFAFLGNVGTPTAEVAVPLCLDKKRIFFGAFTGARLLRKDPPDRYVFNYRASYWEETGAIVEYLMAVRKIKADQIAVFDQEDGYGQAGFDGVAKALRKHGLAPDDILRVRYKRNTIDIDAAVEKILKNKDRVRAVVMVPTYRTAAAFVKRLRDQDCNPIFTSVSFVGSEALAEEFRELGVKYADGVIVTQVVPHYDSSATGVLEYRDCLSQYAPAEKAGFISLEGYIAAKIFCRGLELAGPELTTENLVNAVETIRNLDLGIGTTVNYGLSEHQGSHKVWGTMLDDKAHYVSLDL